MALQAGTRLGSYEVAALLGTVNVWALRFDEERGTVGNPIQVTRWDSPAHHIWSDDLTMAEPSVSGTRMTLPVAQATGSIWMLDNVDK